MAFAAIGASCSPRTSVRIARMPALRMDSSSPRGDHEVAQSGTAAFICCKFVLTFRAEIFNVPILFYCFSELWKYVCNSAHVSTVSGDPNQLSTATYSHRSPSFLLS